MRIRSTAKAVILRENHILLQRCAGPEGGVNFELPGGGQHAGETMEDAVLRECLEETGYTVRVERFLALAEELIEDETLLAQYPGYAHRIFHVFLCTLTDAPHVMPAEEDCLQLGMEWTPVDAVEEIILRPDSVRRTLRALLTAEHAAYLGSERLDHLPVSMDGRLPLGGA